MKQRIEHTKPAVPFLTAFQDNLLKTANAEPINVKDPKRIPTPLNVLYLPAITVKFREGPPRGWMEKPESLLPISSQQKTNSLLVPED